MNKLSLLISIITFLLSIQNGKAQNLFTEVGLGIGNVIGEEHTLGKSEIYFTILKTYKFGQIGLDLSAGGNFIPGSRSIILEDTETLSPNDVRFGSISALYRLPVKEHLFIEARLGYASLSHFVHTDTEDKIKQSNFTYGIGVGATVFNRLTLSLRYQHFGVTPAYEGLKNTTTVKSNSESVNMVLLRVAYRFNWNKLKKQNRRKSNDQ